MFSINRDRRLTVASRGRLSQLNGDGRGVWTAAVNDRKHNQPLRYKQLRCWKETKEEDDENLIVTEVIHALTIDEVPHFKETDGRTKL